MYPLGLKNISFIEVLFVSALCVIGVALILFLFNPEAKQASARDVQRLHDVELIMDALVEYTQSNNGTLPATITVDEGEICATQNTHCDGLVDLSSLTANGKYLTAIPRDPLCEHDGGATCSEQGTGYFVQRIATGAVAVVAYGAEEGIIAVTR